MASGELSQLLRKMAPGDAIVIGSGDETIVIQVKKASENTLRLCVLAPKEKTIFHARNGALIGSDS